jgi:hypothetical protein
VVPDARQAARTRPHAALRCHHGDGGCAQVGRVRDGRQVRRALCLAVGGARILFAEGLPPGELEVAADRLNAHLFRVTGIRPDADTLAAAGAAASAAATAGAVRYDCLGREFSSVKVIDFDEVLDGVSPFQPFFADVDTDGWWADLVRQRATGG